MDNYKQVLLDKIAASDGTREARIEIYSAVRKEVFELPLDGAPGQARHWNDEQLLAIIRELEADFPDEDIIPDVALPRG